MRIVVVEDQGEAVTGSLLELAEAGLVGLLLSIIVLYFFLRHWPSTLMVTTAIPICFVMTLGFMYFANRHTLGAIFARNLMSAEAIDRRRQSIIDMVIGYLKGSDVPRGLPLRQPTVLEPLAL